MEAEQAEKLVNMLERIANELRNINQTLQYMNSKIDNR